MDLLIDIVNSVFIIVGLYFVILFLMIFSIQKKKMLNRPKVKKFPSISIIIPAYNEEENIERTVSNIKEISYPKKKEIIVVNDGSTDRTYEIAKRIKGIKVLNKKNGGKASALNFGLKHAKGEIVVCIDSDSYPEKNALLKTIPFFEKDVASVTTTVIVKNTKKIIERLQELEYIMIAWSRKILEYLECIYVTPGPMSLYRRDALLEVGGFDEKNLTEDIEIAWRLMKYKYKIKMDLDTRVYTTVPNTIKKWWHQRIRWNIGGIQTTIKYFNLFLKKEFRNIGMFLLPLFSISYILNFVGILFLIYVFYRWAQFYIGAFYFGFNPIGPLFLNIIPDVFLFLILVSSILTGIYIKMNIKTMKKVTNVPKKFLDWFLYIFVYMCVSPLNLLHSSFKFLLKKYEW